MFGVKMEEVKKTEKLSGGANIFEIGRSIFFYKSFYKLRVRFS